MKRNPLLLPGLFIVILACTIPEPPPLPTTPTPVSPLLSPTRIPIPTWTPLTLPTPAPTPTPAAVTARLDANLNPAAHPARAPLLIHFSRPMDPASTDAPLVFVPPVAGTFTWDDTATLLIFIPAEGFLPGKQHAVSVSRALKTADGQALPANMPRWTLTIAPAPEAAVYGPGNALTCLCSEG